jgi:hypothetical protein
MREGTTSRVMAADRPFGEFYDFYSVSPEYFGYHHVRTIVIEYTLWKVPLGTVHTRWQIIIKLTLHRF